MPVTVRQISPRPPRGRTRVAVIVSTYNPDVTTRLRDGAIQELDRRLGDQAEAAVIPAPGSFELPGLASLAAATGRFHAIVALGCLIKGETCHDRIIADAVATGLTAVASSMLIPVTFGVLTVDSHEQAMARAGGDLGNKGAEAMSAALDCLGVRVALLGQ